jgi:hypothetical protein
MSVSQGFARVSEHLARYGHPYEPLWLDTPARTCAEAAEAQVQMSLVFVDQDLQFGEVWAAAGHPNGVFKASPQQLCEVAGVGFSDVACGG